MKHYFSSYTLATLLIYSTHLIPSNFRHPFLPFLSNANATQTQGLKLRVSNLNLKQSNLRKLSFSVSAGSGWIKHSDYPDVISPGYGLNVSDGGYDLKSNTMLLNIDGRYVKISPRETLRDGKTIRFTVTKIIIYKPNNPFSRFLIPGLNIESIHSYGQLRKDGNKIYGQFTVEGLLIPSKGREGGHIKGSISGEFVLLTKAGASSIFKRPLEDEGRVLNLGGS